MTKKVVGIGGIFFKARDPKALGAWYAKHLGVEAPHGFAMFQWRHADAPEKEGMTVWSVKSADTTYFAPSQAPFMINYIVEDLDAVLAALRAEGVTVDEKKEDEYGKFGWAMDPEGNRIELWEPPKDPPKEG
jgi:predicted enzyme related to lactoylglutathione lyase